MATQNMMRHTDPNTISFTESNAVGPSFWVTGTAPGAVTASPRSSNSWAMSFSVTGPFQLGSRDNQILQTTSSQPQINRKNQIQSSERRGLLSQPSKIEIEKEKRKNKESQQPPEDIIVGKSRNPGGYSCYLYTTIGLTTGYSPQKPTAR